VVRYRFGGQVSLTFARNAGYVRAEPTICLRFRMLGHPKPQTKAIGAILLLLTGRCAGLARLSGPGARELSAVGLDQQAAQDLA
jgi:hypothetical protein